MGRLRVLVVEDDSSLRRVIRAGLEADGLEVIEVDGCAAALKAVEGDDIAGVILDLKLPDGSGWGVLRTLRSSPLRQLPVVIISAEPPDVARIDALHPQGYLRKPFDVRALVSQVRAVLADGR